MNKILSFVKKYTIDQWNAIEEEYQPKYPPSSKTIKQVVGLYLVVALILFARRFVFRDIFQANWGDLPSGSADKVFYRRHFWIWFLTFLYLIPPYLYARFVLGLGFKDMGFYFKGITKHLPVYFLFFLVVFPAAYFVSYTAPFLKKYPLYSHAGRDLLHFFRWEMSYAIYFISVEFFYRGFMLFGAVRAIGVMSIPVMVIPYMMIHYPKPELECLGAIIAGMALGVMALRTKSIYFGILLHIAIAWSMDILVLGHKGQLNKLFFE